ncbi:tetratricopeptide repeat protein [Candidatus Desulfofervidus auxilii]|uniref:Tetratricopeptide repeat protein n=1 Tax=Desulfofervidus auxilii TaxID=1621989 RepID=A0A7U4QMQ3_DESA2|nr:tetratricopeptide repeat protein [Candidatus Desulfofervidus auxilii]AMM42192.1 tetratricopeptide repeat protein [Candidatus Desulfofervidus auxilii]
MEWPVWIFPLLLITLIIGFFFGRRFSPKDIQEAKESKIAFLTGFRYLLSKESDRAIEAFMKAVRLDTETVETYFALASLFRDKGEIERAISIHQSIITRPRLDEAIRLQALYDLALDYKKAGLFDRAIDVFKEVIRRNPQKKEAYLELANVYQVLKDWAAAYTVIQRLDKITGEDHSIMLAHFQTEIGKKLQMEDKRRAEDAFKKAIKINKKCIDAYLHLGDLYFEQKNIKKALSIWEEVIKISPEYSFLVYSRLEKIISEIKEERVFRKFIQNLEKKRERDIYSALFISKYYLGGKNLEKAEAFVNEVLQKAPTSVGARQLLSQIFLEKGEVQKAISLLTQISQNLLPQKSYQCSQCGYEATKLSWWCPQCQRWDTIKPKGIF